MRIQHDLETSRALSQMGLDQSPPAEQIRILCQEVARLEAVAGEVADERETAHQFYKANGELIAMISKALEAWAAWSVTDDNSWDALNDAFEELSLAFMPYDANQVEA